ncbi:MAG: hypothetical protein JOZ17_12630, partial [Acetobacteraceae bacterium]|nr:hypothetical protein [Acetobacteraceae bacterium]
AIEDVATRFGVSENHVKQRLRLGKLAPELLDAFRAGDIGLELVTTFTLGADHAAQIAVWRQVKDQSYVSPYSVRRMLTQSAVTLDSRLGLFVGPTAYEAAGGTITRDLFSGDEDGFMNDAWLVQRLAIEKLEAKAEELRPRWAWTKAVLDPEYGFMAQYARLQPKPGKLPAELAEERERIEQRLAAIEEELGEKHWNEELASEAATLEERRAEIEKIEENLAVYSTRDRKRAGCIVTIGEDGEFCLHQGLIDRSTLRNTAPTETGDADGEACGDGDDEFDAGISPESDNDGFSRSSRSAELAMRKELGFSQSLVDDLKAHRLQIARAHLSAHFEVAFDLALYWLCVDLFDRFGYRARSLDLKAVETTPRSSLNDLEGTPADRLLQAHRPAAADLQWLQLPPAEGFAALAGLPVEAKQRLFAWCIAACVKPQLALEDSADPALECAGRRLAIPFADYWRPTALNYWGRVKKAHGLAIGQQILGDRWARDHANDKKPVLAAALEAAFDPAQSANCIALDQAARDNAAAWMPPGMPFDADAVAEPDGLGSEDGEAADPDLASADLPAFLTENDQAGAGLNGASAS